MKLLKITLLVFIFCTSANLNGQMGNMEKARKYFEEAQNQFDLENYVKVEKYIIRTEKELNAIYFKDTSFAVIMNLKLKTFYELKRYSEAKDVFKKYEKKYMRLASDEVNKEAYSYYTKIEDAISDSITKYYITKKKNSIINLFEYKDCLRCKGLGKYSATEEKYGKKPLLRKNEFVTCEICEGKRILLEFNGIKKYFRFNSGEEVLTLKEFKSLYENEIKSICHINYDRSWINGKIRLYIHNDFIEILDDEEVNSGYNGYNQKLKELTRKGFEIRYEDKINEYLKTHTEDCSFLMELR